MHWRRVRQADVLRRLRADTFLETLCRPLHPVRRVRDVLDSRLPQPLIPLDVVEMTSHHHSVTRWGGRGGVSKSTCSRALHLHRSPLNTARAPRVHYEHAHSQAYVFNNNCTCCALYTTQHRSGGSHTQNVCNLMLLCEPAAAPAQLAAPGSLPSEGFRWHPAFRRAVVTLLSWRALAAGPHSLRLPR